MPLCVNLAWGVPSHRTMPAPTFTPHRRNPVHAGQTLAPCKQRLTAATITLTVCPMMDQQRPRGLSELRTIRCAPRVEPALASSVHVGAIGAFLVGSPFNSMHNGIS